MSPSVSADTPDAFAALRAVPLLAALPDDQLRALWGASVPREHPAGQVLRRAGAPATHLLLLLRGRVSAGVTTPDGRLVTHGEWTGPRALDKVAVIDGRGHTATLTATTPCLVRALPRDRFLALTDDAPAVRAHVLRVLAAEVRRERARFTAAATRTTEARLADWLLINAGAAGAGGRVPFPGAGTQQDLADHLGVSRVTVNRALARLRRAGLVEVDRCGVLLRAPELLRLRSCSPR
ncbi:Crp/Fnr family transcriptional regulator [Streptomyces litchfieldiae]|uniref:Crp/Fnr family transcriptional regulator n=1 Tax=Streptomyces litchfieldiae TaxID=3075543 RepID=A0ABU2MKP4_9ACTN|nr:Crp/Fnr family transcriptional regulator [Streptomyces sp. DSM 44938]MDT0342176.1 Crp/Fnr family transcriptional regulator [Streptomyces sp. DSM 44938]